MTFNQVYRKRLAPKYSRKIEFVGTSAIGIEVKFCKKQDKRRAITNSGSDGLIWFKSGEAKVFKTGIS